MGISGLPKDITRRLPEVVEGERRWWSGRLGGRWGGDSTSARVAWLVAARWLRRALAAAPRLRRRRRPAAWLPGADGEAEELGRVVAGDGGVSRVNLKVDLPRLVESDKEAHPPLSSTSLKSSRSFASSAFILLSEFWTIKMSRSLSRHVLAVASQC